MPETVQDIRLSVAVVTRNRLESLERCLKSWRAQTVQPEEIIVSDDSDPQLAPQMETLVRRYGCKYVAGPRRGLYANRNSAVSACSGTHILTGDDDHSHPPDYLEKVSALVRQDPDRIWIFAERFLDPNSPLDCPPELHRSGVGISPADPSDCAAIADGSSVYPRRIFDSGLRYDDTYPFGGLWYLWGKVLVKHGWRITFSDQTFVWHHALVEGRLDDPQAVKDSLECMMYVLFVNAFWINPSIENIFWSFAYLGRRMIFEDSIMWYRVKSRISPQAAVRLLHNAWTYPRRIAQQQPAMEKVSA